MSIPKFFAQSSTFIGIIALFCSTPALTQSDEPIVEIELPTAKNTIGIRPQYFLFGFYGLSYERYIAKNYSIFAYAEVCDGPKLLNKNVNALVQNSMNLEAASIYYSGFGGAIGVRRYFTDKKYSLVGNKDLGALVGWFVGAYIPLRKMKINMTTESMEFHNFAFSQDKGKYSFNGLIYGLGLEGGRHWVWGNFSFEVNAGFTYMQGMPRSATFNYSWTNGLESYPVDKKLGIVSLYGTFAPKIEFVLGLGF